MTVYSARPHCTQSRTTVTAYSAWRLVVRYPHSTKSRPLSATNQPWCSSQIFVQNRNLCLPRLHSTPPLGESRTEYCHDVWYGKTRMVWLPTVKNFLKCLFVSTESTNVTDGQTDRHRTTAKAALA